jgi:hypothetical protein
VRDVRQYVVSFFEKSLQMECWLFIICIQLVLCYGQGSFCTGCCQHGKYLSMDYRTVFGQILKKEKDSSQVLVTGISIDWPEISVIVSKDCVSRLVRNDSSREFYPIRLGLTSDCCLVVVELRFHPQVCLPESRTCRISKFFTW